MIAAKAKEAWHEDKRAFPQSFFRNYLIFEKGVAILYSQAEKSLNQIVPTRNTCIAEPHKPLGRGGGRGSTKCQGKKGGENWSKLCRVWNRLGDPSVLTHFLDGID